ncbi:MAG: metallophosphoesterase [Candidatus Omnitrophica bacterium]|nr:metallophosphoesterase [Candidatus Omnitrophota bacterium]
MDIAIVADSHDNLPIITKAVRIFNQRKVEFLIHCGDYIAPFSLKPFKDLNCDWAGVLGNNDGEKIGLSKISQNRIKEAPFVIEINNRKIGLTHILNQETFSDSRAGLDLIVFGHTHEVYVGRDDVLTVNPGELGGWVTGKSSAIILNLETLVAEIINL